MNRGRRDPLKGNQTYEERPQRVIDILRPKVPSHQISDQARFHEKNRILAVHEILFHLHQMAVRTYIAPSSGITIGGAKVQWGRSSGVMQAAHWVPGQIFIGSNEPGAIARSKATQMDRPTDKAHRIIGSRLDLLFGLTDNLHL